LHVAVEITRAAGLPVSRRGKAPARSLSEL
jgi:hypothetical protein